MGVIDDESKYVDEEKKVALFRKVVSILNRNNIEYWLEFGTLLGYVRDKRFIPWDADVDLGTFQILRVYSLFDIFRAEGLHVELNYNFTDEMTTFVRISDESFHVDLYGFESTDEGVILKCNRYRSFLARFFRVLYLELKHEGCVSQWLLRCAVRFSDKRVFIYPPFLRLMETKYYDMPVYIPMNPENHLRLMYGESWMTPTKDDVAGKQHVFKQERKRTYYRLRE